MRLLSTVTARAGERTEIVRRFGGSIPTDFTIVVTPASGPVEGDLEVRGSRWIWWKDPERRPLVPSQTVTKGFWDTRFSVVVIPRHDARVEAYRGRPS